MKPDEPNREWGRSLVRTLMQSGVSRFFLSPGARSTPIVAALAELCPARVTTHFDERGMAFAALGWAKASGSPAAAITTSGSAVANLHPAVIEAAFGEIPLVLVTADRPPELHGRGANQTIEQEGIFGSAVRLALNLPCPGDVRTPRIILSEIARAVRLACVEPRGPVHLNIPIREPLLSSRPEFSDQTEFLKSAKVNKPEMKCEGEIPADFFDHPEGVILLGALNFTERTEVNAVVTLGEQLGWPVLADPLSGAKGMPGTVCHADLFLHRRELPPPTRTLHFGGALVSKRITEWVRPCCGSRYLQVRPSATRLDPFFQNPKHLRIGLGAFCREAEKLISSTPRTSWIQQFWRLEATATFVIAREVDALLSITEPSVARVVSATWQSALFLGNSMPVRDFETFAGLRHGSSPVYANRGASGIDGNIATIAGLTMGLESNLLGVIGDLAFLHDLPSLALLRELPVVILVVNNGGGGIFRFVPGGLSAAERERFWEIPHGMVFEASARQFGLSYERPSTPEELRKILSCPIRNAMIVECITDREENERLHRQLALRICAIPLADESGMRTK